MDLVSGPGNGARKKMLMGFGKPRTSNTQFSTANTNSLLVCIVMRRVWCQNLQLGYNVHWLVAYQWQPILPFFLEPNSRPFYEINHNGAITYLGWEGLDWAEEGMVREGEGLVMGAKVVGVQVRGGLCNKDRREQGNVCVLLVLFRGVLLSDGGRTGGCSKTMPLL